jgi:hypothetical protein
MRRWMRRPMVHAIPQNLVTQHNLWPASREIVKDIRRPALSVRMRVVNHPVVNTQTNQPQKADHNEHFWDIQCAHSPLS